MLLLASKGVIK